MDMEILKMEVDSILKDFNYNGAVCVYAKNRRLFASASGMADRERNLPVTPETTFFTASVTKQFTAVCIMMAYEKKLVDIDALLSVYIPEYSHASEITVRQALNMAGGIPDYMNDILDPAIEKEVNDGSMTDEEFTYHCCNSCSDNFTYEDILGFVNELPLRFAPGSKMEYSNTGYYFLGVILERVTGMKLGDFMKKNIFEPVGMKNTSVGSPQAVARCYTECNGKVLNIGTCLNTSGDACVVTNVYDLSLWLQAILKGKLLGKETWKLVFDMGDRNYGFGYRSIDGWYYHNGALKLYRSGTYIHFKKKLTIAMLASAENNDYGRDKEYCIERRLRRTVEDFFTFKPGKVKLYKVSKDNLDECLELKVTPEQQNQILPTAELLAEAYVNKTYKPFVVMDSARYVGFVCLNIDKANSVYNINTVFVSQRLQLRGYGRLILKLACDELKKAGASEVKAHVHHNNDSAKAFFTACGFNDAENGNFVYKIS